MIEIGREYIPTPVQQEFHNACLRYPVVIFVGAVGAGKTTALIWQVIDDCLAVRYNRGVLAKQTYEDLEDALLPDLLLELELSKIPYHHYKRRRCLVFPQTGSVVHLLGLGDTIKHLHRTKGMNLGFVAIDQIEDVPREVVVFQLTRLRLPNVPANRRHLFATANPVPEDHWLYEFVYGDPDRGIPPAVKSYVVRATLDDNPHLPEDYKNLLTQSLSDEEKERYVRGEFGFLPYGNRVFPMFDKNLHVFPVEFDEKYPLIIGMDFGYRHPAAVWVQVVGEPEDEALRKVIVLDEYFGKDLLLDDFIGIVKERTSAYYPKAEIVFWCGDPFSAAQKTSYGEAIQETLRIKHNIPLRTRRVPVDQSVNNVAGLLRQRRLLVHPKCKILIKALQGGYRRDEYGEIVKDGFYDHIVDALRYALDVFAPFGSIHSIVPALNRAFRLKRVLGQFRPT